MKLRILILTFAAFTILQACDSFEYKKFDKPKTLADSIAYYLGVSNGHKIAADIDSLPAERRERFNRDEFAKGLQTGLLTDTTRESILMGYLMVDMINAELERYKKHGVTLHRPTIAAAYREVLIDNAVDSMTCLNEGERIKAFVAEIQRPDFNHRYDADMRSRQFGHSAAYRFKSIMTSVRTASGKAINPTDFMEGIDTLFKIPDDNEGYAAGINLGCQLLSFILEQKNLDIIIDPERVFFHFYKAFKSGKSLKRIEEILYKREIDRLVNAAIEKSPIAVKNADEGKAFIDSLAMNDPNLQIALSGLAYIIHKQGAGPVVTKKTPIQLTFEGRLTNGTVFDRIETPSEVNVAELIPGLQEGVLMLNRGGEATFIIPCALAYGVKGSPGKIPPMATLIYDVKIYN